MHIDNLVSIGIILSVLVLTFLTSIIFPNKEAHNETGTRNTQG